MPRKRLRLLTLIGCLLTPAPFAGAEIRIAVEAAHGGDDPGSRAGVQTEKRWNLRFGRAIADALKAAGHRPILVREKDETLSRVERLDRIRSATPALVLVVHCDREATGLRSGPLIVLHPPMNSPDPPGLLPWGWISHSQYRVNLKWARTLAQFLGIRVAFQTLSDRQATAGETPSWSGGILCAPHTDLRGLSCPALVLTPLFITSKTDVEGYAKDEAVAAFAEKVVAAVNSYYNVGKVEP